MLLLPSTRFRGVLLSSARPSLALSFMNGKLDPRITFSRGSSATYFDNSGTLRTAGVDTPRFEYDVVTGALRGLLSEEQRTNYVYNPRAEGFVAPSTYPPDWSQSEGSGVSPIIVGTGTEDGIPYVDVRWSGTTTAVGNMNFFPLTPGPAASPGQVWTTSCYVRIVDGDFTNLTNFSILSSDNSPAGNHQNGPGTPTTAPLKSQRWLNTFTVATGATAINGVGIQITNIAPGPINITLRIGAPQLEQGNFASSSILPPVGSPAVTTRAADYTDLSSAGWLNPNMGAIIAVFVPRYLPAVGNPNGVFQLSDGTINNQVQDYIYSDGLQHFEIKEAGNFQPGSGGPNQQVNFGRKNTGAATWSSSGGMVIADGNLYQPTGAVNVPVMSRLSLGYGNGWLNGWLQELTYYPRMFSVSEIQSNGGESYDDYLLDLDFLDGSGLENFKLQFTRASGATYFDSSGVMRLAGSNRPRLDCDPVTHEPLGLLMEAQRTNYIPNSLSSSPGWTSSVSTDVSALYPAATVWKSPLTNGNLGAYGNVPAASGSFTFSMWLWIPSSYSSGAPRLDLDGTYGTGATLSIGRADLTKRDQWQRVVSTMTLGTGASAQFNLVLRNDAPTNSADFIYHTCWQYENGNFATSYIPTSGSAATRAADYCYYLNPLMFGSSDRSIAVEFSRCDAAVDTSAYAGMFAISDSSSTDFVNLFSASSNTYSGLESWQYLGNVASPPQNGLPITDTKRHSYVITTSASGSASISIDGGNTYSNTFSSYTVPMTLDRINVGYGRFGPTWHSVHIARIRYWNRLLTAAEAQQVSA